MRQRGYTLLEVLVAAAIGAAVAVGLSGFFLAEKAVVNEKAGQAISYRLMHEPGRYG